MIDYRKLRPSNLNSPEFCHLWLLLFWPVFGICFSLLERGGFQQAFHPVWCPLDDRIPFCEWFMIPYLFWFVFLTGMVVYLLFFDARAFRRFMYFIMITYCVTLAVYLVYPTCQNLRPTDFPRDNLLTRIIRNFYAFDTNTNVCPSIHVAGSMAVAFGAWDTPRFRKIGWKIAFFLTAVLISVSTVFVKQHSVVDVFCAFLLCGAAYVLVYRLPQRLGRKETADAAAG